VLNFTAFQDAKSRFDAYTGFPFIVSMFWVYLYGAVLAPATRRMRRGLLELLFAGVSLSATFALAQSEGPQFEHLARAMGKPYRLHRDVVHGFVAALADHRPSFGRRHIDQAVAALTVETLRLDEEWYAGIGPMDTLAFHGATSSDHDELMADMVANRFDVCTMLPPTKLRVCSREPLPSDTFAGLTTEVVPAIFAFTTFRSDVRVEPQGIVVRNGVVMTGPLGKLPRGTYELTLGLDAVGPAVGPGSGAATLGVVYGDTKLASANFASGSHQLVVAFEADGVMAPEFVFESHGFTLTITHTSVRPRNAGNSHAP
jgi:hypothetical protein